MEDDFDSFSDNPAAGSPFDDFDDELPDDGSAPPRPFDFVRPAAADRDNPWEDWEDGDMNPDRMPEPDDAASRKDTPRASGRRKAVAGLMILTALLITGICVLFMVASRKRPSSVPTEPASAPTAAYAEPEPTGPEPTGPEPTEPEPTEPEPTEPEPAEPEPTQPAEPAVAYPTLKTGSKGEDVKKMQTRFLQLGYIDDRSVTGYFGDYTEKVVKRFQKKAGLEQTGIADSATLTRLYAEDAPKWR